MLKAHYEQLLSSKEQELDAIATAGRLKDMAIVDMNENLERLRAENERLKEVVRNQDWTVINRINEAQTLRDQVKTFSAALGASQDREIDLRKRCEDLEAAVRTLITVANPDEIDAYEAINKANEILSQ